MPLHRLLVGTTGQPALRIIRAAHAEGVEAVVICGESDRADPFAVEADIGVAVTAAPTAGRLEPKQVVQIALETWCEAVHPGFDAEALDPELAVAVESAGLRWVGPCADVVATLSTSKGTHQTLRELGVPTPSDPAAADAGRIIELGFIADADGRVHLLGTRTGAVLADGETVAEEGPAGDLGAALETRLAAAAGLIVRGLGYVNAGTLRVTLDDPRGFAIVGIDPRLQPGHQLVDATTGIDSLRLQLRVAANDPLDLSPTGVPAREHAVWVALRGSTVTPMVSAESLPATDIPGAELSWNVGPGRPPAGRGARIGELLTFGATRADALHTAAAAVEALDVHALPLALGDLQAALQHAADSADAAPVTLGSNVGRSGDHAAAGEPSRLI